MLTYTHTPLLNVALIKVMAISKSVSDISPYVRACAAHAMIKVYRLDEATQAELLPKLEELLKDKAAMVVSAALSTFSEVIGEGEEQHACFGTCQTRKL